MGGSLVGRKADDVRRWADWYREIRKLKWISVDGLINAALREQGTSTGVTKTKLRKAARRLLLERQIAEQTKQRVA